MPAIRRTARRFPVRSRPRRRAEWCRFNQSSIGVAAGAKLTVDLLATFQAAYGAQLIGSTVIRTIVRVAVQAVASGVISDSAWGLIKEDLLFAGKPLANPNADWYWVQGHMSYDASTAAGNAQSVSEIDTRVKRRLNALDETVLWVYDNASGVVHNVTMRADVLLALS